MRDLIYRIFGRYGWVRHTFPAWVRTIPFRVRHGWDYRDCWNLDTVLAEWLGKRLVHLGEVTSCVPGCYHARYDPVVARDVWRHDLKKHGRSLVEYAKRFEIEKWDDESEIVERGVEAMEFVAKNFDELWN